MGSAHWNLSSNHESWQLKFSEKGNLFLDKELYHFERQVNPVSDRRPFEICRSSKNSRRQNHHLFRNSQRHRASVHCRCELYTVSFTRSQVAGQKIGQKQSLPSNQVTHTVIDIVECLQSCCQTRHVYWCDSLSNPWPCDSCLLSLLKNCCCKKFSFLTKVLDKVPSKSYHVTL